MVVIWLTLADRDVLEFFFFFFFFVLEVELLTCYRHKTVMSNTHQLFES